MLGCLRILSRDRLLLVDSVCRNRDLEGLRVVVAPTSSLALSRVDERVWAAISDTGNVYVDSMTGDDDLSDVSVNRRQAEVFSELCQSANVSS